MEINSKWLLHLTPAVLLQINLHDSVFDAHLNLNSSPRSRLKIKIEIKTAANRVVVCNAPFYTCLSVA